MKFTKMQGLGNDFVIIDNDEYVKSGKTGEELAKRLCNRHFGIGADGLIIINPDTKDTDIGWFFYNSDGSKAQMCGNGMRCFAKYVYDKKYVNKKSFSVQTQAGTIIPCINDDGTVTVNMNKPILKTEIIPVKTNDNNFKIKVQDKTFDCFAVSMGNPHCVIFTNENIKFLAENYGSSIEKNALFPEKTNVEFINIISKSEIDFMVWERGCGITLACGTGACASVVSGILQGYLDNKVKVNLLGGNLTVEWNGNKSDTDKNVFMTGRADYVFEGEIFI